MKSNTIVTGYKTLMVISYKYNYQNILGFIVDKEGGSTHPGDNYLSLFCYTNTNGSICPVSPPCIIFRYFNSCNAIVNHIKMH